MDESLNEAQFKAVNTLSGPLLVLAGAGTGKTRVVTLRVARLIQAGIRPDRILAVTFTNKAAAEMHERIGGILGKQLETHPQISTFHAHCVQVLRRHIQRLGYPRQFAIHDAGDQRASARSVLRDLSVQDNHLTEAQLLAFINNWKLHGTSHSQASAQAKTDKEHIAAVAFRRYEQSLKTTGAVDFDDLLLITLKLFNQFPDVRQEEADRFDHLLVDEFQDTNECQYEIIRHLARDHRNLCVVGDDDQAIYGWRGADVSHILGFERDWEGATVVRLEENYRCTHQIVEHANRLIEFNKHRHDKVLRASRAGAEKPKIHQYTNEEKEAKGIVADIQRHLKMPGEHWEPRDFSILFRTNNQLGLFERALRGAGIPYIVIGGTSFFDQKEVKDALAYLRLLVRPQDDTALLRVINCPRRGIGHQSLQKLVQLSIDQGQSLWKFISANDPADFIADRPARAIRDFANMIRRFQQDAKRPGKLAATAYDLMDAANYHSEIERLYVVPDERQVRTERLDELLRSLGSYEKRNTKKKRNLQGFLDELALGSLDFVDEKGEQLRQNCVILITYHSAKGLEFPHVYMVGMEDGILPHQRSIADDERNLEEERRLCYVGMTRAQERLTLSFPLTRVKWGKPRDTIPSRFLFEIVGKATNPHKLRK